MAHKDALNKLLDSDESGIKRGKGLTFSVDEVQKPPQQPLPTHKPDAFSQKRTIAETQKPKYPRVNRGYAIREDIIKRCKSLALDMNKPLYEIMESALLEYLHAHKK